MTTTRITADLQELKRLAEALVEQLSTPSTSIQIGGVIYDESDIEELEAMHEAVDSYLPSWPEDGDGEYVEYVSEIRQAGELLKSHALECEQLREKLRLLERTDVE